MAWRGHRVRCMRVWHLLVIMPVACANIDSAEEAEAVHNASAECTERALPSPSYPQLPLSLARDYKHAAPINFDYPGLQLVHVSPSGAPLYIINGFLNATECDALVAKLASERSASVVYQQNRDGVDKTTSRTSTHVRVTKAETPGLHGRVAELTQRKVANMESAKIIHYAREQEFTRHFDYSGTEGSKSRFKALDGRPIPRHINRDLTLFVFLNDVAEGGETAFYDATKGWQAAPEYMRIKPRAGLAVLFHATVQPEDGVFPRAASSFGARDGFKVDPSRCMRGCRRCKRSTCWCSGSGRHT